MKVGFSYIGIVLLDENSGNAMELIIIQG